MKIDLSGRVVIVTGSGRGIGRGHALALARRGASVIVNDIGGDVHGIGSDLDPARDVVSEIVAAGGMALADTSDASTREGAEHLVELAIKHFGRIDAVVANAGITGQHQLFVDTRWELLYRMIAMHVHGPWGLAQAAWPHFAKQGRGRIVFTSSGSWVGAERASAYATAKAAVVGLTKSLALEGKPQNILVNAVAPMALTRMSSAEVTKDMAEIMARTVPANSVAPAVVAMVSDEWTGSGEVYLVGGGHMAWFFIGQTQGIDRGVDWTPDDVLAGIAAVHDDTGFSKPRSDFDVAARYVLGTEDLAGFKFHGG